jgi:hypothetical protein
MKDFSRYFILTVIISFLFFSCEGEFELNDNPTSLTLVLPVNNQECFGTNLPNGKISVAFDWEDVTGVSSYSLEYEDNVSGEQFMASSADSSLNLELEAGTQYTWKVTVIDESGNPRTSDPFNFYTEGLADENYVPFPAEISIMNGGNGTLNISWDGSDLDNDIEFYDVFFSSQNPPVSILSETTAVTTTVNVLSGITYYLNVRTVDRNGNFSDSILTIMSP